MLIRVRGWSRGRTRRVPSLIDRTALQVRSSHVTPYSSTDTLIGNTVSRVQYRSFTRSIRFASRVIRRRLASRHASFAPRICASPHTGRRFGSAVAYGWARLGCRAPSRSRVRSWLLRYGCSNDALCLQSHFASAKRLAVCLFGVREQVGVAVPCQWCQLLPLAAGTGHLYSLYGASF